MKDKADVTIAIAVEVFRVEVSAFEIDMTFVRTVESAQQVQQRTFARAGPSEDRDPGPGFKRQIDTAQDVEILRPKPVVLVQSGGLQDGGVIVFQGSASKYGFLW